MLFTVSLNAAFSLMCNGNGQKHSEADLRISINGEKVPTT